MVRCIKCNKEIPIDSIGPKFIEAFTDQWYGPEEDGK